MEWDHFRVWTQKHVGLGPESRESQQDEWSEVARAHRGVPISAQVLPA